MVLLEVDGGRQLDIEAGATPAYPQWPDVRGGCFDSFAPALLGARALYQALSSEDEEALWITPGQVAEYTGLGQRLVDLRVRARLQGVKAAWPWTRVRKDRRVYLPQLWEEVIWIANPHAKAYLEVAPIVYHTAVKRGYLTGAYRPFRGVDRLHLREGLPPGNNAVYLPDVLKYKQLLGLRRLFGKRFSYRQLEALRHVSPQAVARMKAGRLLSSELSSDDD